MLEIDKLNRKLEKLEADIDNNSDGDPHYLGELMSERDKIDEKINAILYKDFLSHNTYNDR